MFVPSRALAATSLLALLALAPLVAASTPPAGPPVMTAAEVIQYGWRLEGFLGSLAGLFFPSRGIGTLTTRTTASGEIETILHITTQAKSGEHWTYGSLLAADGTPQRAWSSYTFRGESKQKENTVSTPGVRDIASAIYHLRREPPTTRTTMTIWSEGKLYPVEVLPRPGVEVDLPAGRVRTRQLTVRGIEQPGQRLWKGRLELWFAEDAAATPVVISVERKSARVRLEQDERLAARLAR